MNTQLRLLDPGDQQWKLDETTRRIGLQGLAQARRALEQADLSWLRSDDDPDPSHTPSTMQHAA